MNGAFYFTFSSLTIAVRGVPLPIMEPLILNYFFLGADGKTLQYSFTGFELFFSGAYFIFPYCFTT